MTVFLLLITVALFEALRRISFNFVYYSSDVARRNAVLDIHCVVGSVDIRA